MTISITSLYPINNQRQVPVATNMTVSVVSDSYDLNLTGNQLLEIPGTLNVKINGTSAIYQGEFQIVANTFSPITTGTQFIQLVNANNFSLGEKVVLGDAYSGPFENSILSISGSQLKLRSAVQDLTTDTYIESLSRGFDGSISYNSPTDAVVNINPRVDLKLNNAYVVTVEASDTADSYKKEVFSFRTVDTLPPQVFDFPPVIQNSELSFRIVDILQNEALAQNLTLSINGKFAIKSGQFQPEFAGTLYQVNSSELRVFVRSRIKFLNNQEIRVEVQITDKFNNINYSNHKTLNKTQLPKIELIEISPKENSVLNPLNTQVVVRLKTDVPLQKRFFNVSFIGGTLIDVTTQTNEHPAISRGSFSTQGIFVDPGTTPETGSIIFGHEIIATINKPHAIDYNQRIQARIFLQLMSEQKISFVFYQSITGQSFDTIEAKYFTLTIDDKTYTFWMNVLDSLATQIPPSVNDDLIQVDILYDNSALEIVSKIRYVVEPLFSKVFTSTYFDEANEDALLIFEAKTVDVTLDGSIETGASLLFKEEGVPIAAPFFERRYSYSTTSSYLGPIIDQFKPSPTDLVSPTTPISFRALSLTANSPVNLSTLSVSINDIIAIGEGSFFSGFTGTTTFTRGSENNALQVVINSITPYEIGSTLSVDISVEDQAGNLSTQNNVFTVANTNAPIVSITPVAGSYNKPIRVKIDTDQPTQIYYTINGSVPQIGNINTFVGTNPVENVPVFSQGITQVKAIAVNAAGIQSAVQTVIYDVNEFPPVVTITAPVPNISQDQTTSLVSYSIELKRGFLTKVEFALNAGPRTNLFNTLSSSSFLVAGLISGTNTVSIYATDNSGNVGIQSIKINVNPSNIDDFTLKYAPLACPVFTTRVLKTRDFFNDFIDTATVVLLGYGKRKETLITFAVGEGRDGRPVDFKAGNPQDGRHFQVNSFPILPSSLIITLYRKGRTFELADSDFVFESSSGQIVLDHPLETGEALEVEYISESDINNPEIFTSLEIDFLFTKHGQPSTENTLSLAAQMAFENGATRVLAIQPLPLSQDSQWFHSFQRLEKEQGYWIIPVLSNADYSYYPSIRLAAFKHSEKMTEIKYRNERVVIGQRLNNEPNSFNSELMSLVHLDLNPKVTRIVDGEVRDLNGSFVTAAVAGRFSSFSNVAMSATNKSLAGFNLSTKLKKSPKLDLDILIGQGFMPVQTTSSGGLVVRSRTSTLSGSPILEEVSIQRTIHYISKNLRKLLQDGFLGQLIDPNLISNIRSSGNSFLSSQNSIQRGTVSKVFQDLIEPRQVNVVVELTPLFPLNDIVISFNVVVNI